jgi:DNA-binding MarR family transcriptional regulator
MALTERSWTFLTNHGHVLVALALDPGTRVRDVAEKVGITPRAAQTILKDLEDAGYIQRERVGRRNRYVILTPSHLRHPLEGHVTIGDFLAVLASR